MRTGIDDRTRGLQHLIREVGKVSVSSPRGLWAVTDASRSPATVIEPQAYRCFSIVRYDFIIDLHARAGRRGASSVSFSRRSQIAENRWEGAAGQGGAGVSKNHLSVQAQNRLFHASNLRGGADRARSVVKSATELDVAEGCLLRPGRSRSATAAGRRTLRERKRVCCTGFAREWAAGCPSSTLASRSITFALHESHERQFAARQPTRREQYSQDPCLQQPGCPR